MNLYDDPFLDFDDLSEGDDDPDLPLLREFLDRWESAQSHEDHDAILQEHCERHPRLAERFRGLVEATSIVRYAKEPDPVQLGPYKILRVLAIGGMGRVYEAEDETLVRTVAVKTIRVGRAADPTLLDRFNYEREALARLHHTHIVPIYSAGEDDGLLYFAMPLIRGLSLGDLVSTMNRWSSGASSRPTSWEEILGKATTDATWRRSVRRMSRCPAGATSAARPPRSGAETTAPAVPRLPLTEDYFRHVAEILAVAAEAIHSAHEAGVLHFDVKPSNILIERVAGKRGESVHPWVIDFGLADPAGTETDRSSPEEPGPGQRTRGFGTRGFMAPEMLMLREVSDRAPPRSNDRPPLGRQTDVWSLGVTLYQLLTLRMPFADDDAVLDPKIGPGEHLAHLPGELQAVVLKALKKPQEDRYATAAAFAEDLRRWLAGFPTRAGNASVLKRLTMWARRRPAAAFAAGMTVAFVIASLLGAAAGTAKARAETDKVQAEAHNVRLRAEADEREIQAKKREIQAKKRQLDLLALAGLRAPIRPAGWSEDAWNKVHDLAGGGTDDGLLLQGHAAASLEGIDVHLARSFKKGATMLAFDGEGKRLLMGMFGPDSQGRRIRRLTLGDLMGQDEPKIHDIKSFGVVGFRKSDGVPLFLERDEADPSSLRLSDPMTGQEMRRLSRPLEGSSFIISHALSQNGARAAGVAWPLRKMTPEEKQALQDGRMEPPTDGDTATLVVWDVATGEIIRAFQEKQTPTYDVVLSPDGSSLATWDANGRNPEVAVWSVDDGKSIGRCRSLRTGITSVAFGRDPVLRGDPDAATPWRLAFGEEGGMITIVDLHTRIIIGFLRGSPSDVKTMDFSPDGTLLASAGRGETRLWDVATGDCQLTIPSGNYQLAVNFSPDGRRLAVARLAAHGGDEGVAIHDLDDGRGLRTLRGLRQRIEKVIVSPDGRRIAALTNDWEIGIWDKDSGSLIHIVEAPIGSFTDNAGLAFNSDGSRLACSAGAEARLWDLPLEPKAGPGKAKPGRLLREWKLPPALTEATAFRPDGRLLLVRQETRGAKLPPDARAHPKDHPRVCRAYELPEEGDPMKTMEITDFDWYVVTIVATPSGSHFAIRGTGTGSGKVDRLTCLYDWGRRIRVGALPSTLAADDSGMGMRFDPKGTRLSVRLTSVTARHDVFEVPSLRLTGMFATVPACINPGGTRSITKSEKTRDDPEALALNEQGRPAPLLRIIRDTRGSADTVRFSPDGNHVIWGSDDGKVTVCDLDEVNRRLTALRLGW